MSTVDIYDNPDGFGSAEDMDCGKSESKARIDRDEEENQNQRIFKHDEESLSDDWDEDENDWDEDEGEDEDEDEEDDFYDKSLDFLYDTYYWTVPRRIVYLTLANTLAEFVLVDFPEQKEALDFGMEYQKTAEVCMNGASESQLDTALCSASDKLRKLFEYLLKYIKSKDADYSDVRQLVWFALDNAYFEVLNLENKDVGKLKRSLSFSKRSRLYHSKQIDSIAECLYEEASDEFSR